MSPSRLLSALALVFALLAPAAHAVDLSACGQTIPRRETAVLQQDLICAAAPAVTLERGAVLDFNGHTITMNVVGDAIVSETKCRIVSSAVAPGRLEGFQQSHRGVSCAKKIRIENVDIDGFHTGLSAGRLIQATDVTLTNNKIGARADRLKLENVVAEFNTEIGLGAHRSVKGTGIEANNNDGWGIDAGRSLRATDVTVTNNGIVGIDTSTPPGPTKLTNAVVTGNPIDLLSGRRPRVSGVTCDTSRKQFLNPETWGVCAND